MQTSLTANQILNDIEFELMQGIVSRGDLGEGIQAIQKYQNQARSEILNGHNKISLEDAFSRQLQINDLLLSLNQETIATVQSLQLELHNSAHLKQHQTIESNSYPAQQESDISHQVIHQDTLASIPLSESTSVQLTENDSDLQKIESDLQSTMSHHTLQISPDIRVMNLPIIGQILTRLRMALHNLVLFYTRRLATKQAEVNRIHGERLLELHQTERQNRRQLQKLQEEINL